MTRSQSLSHPDEALADWLEQLDFASGISLGRSNQGEVRRFRFRDTDLAIKTPSGRGALRWLRVQSLKREYRTYRRLEGLPGFARCHGLFDERYLVLDYIEGEDFRHARLADRERFFDRLLETLRSMHARGIAHGDLKRKDNLRIDRDGHPVILDLGTAVRRKPDGGRLNRKLFDFIRQTDLNAWVKLKYGSYNRVANSDRALLKRSRLERWLGRMR